NKEDEGERVSDVSKKRKGGPRIKRMSKRKKTEFDLKEEEDLKAFLKIIKTFSEIVTRFDRLDLVELYNLVMQRFETITPKDGTEIHMLAKRKYPLTKETLERMMSLKLIVESASDSAFDLLRFIQKHIDEAGSHDEGENDL
ncbi:hypothetical protein Tco_1565708, partial [Tanacetum coccineum]